MTSRMTTACIVPRNRRAKVGVAGHRVDVDLPDPGRSSAAAMIQSARRPAVQQHGGERRHGLGGVGPGGRRTWATRPVGDQQHAGQSDGRLSRRGGEQPVGPPTGTSSQTRNKAQRAIIQLRSRAAASSAGSGLSGPLSERWAGRRQTASSKMASHSQREHVREQALDSARPRCPYETRNWYTG